MIESYNDKTNKVAVHPVKTQIGLGISPVWSESSLCAQWIAKDPSFLHADSEDWSDWVDTQADLSLRWAHNHIVGFVTRWLILYPFVILTIRWLNYHSVLTICKQTGTCDTQSGDLVFFSASFDEFYLFMKN